MFIVDRTQNNKAYVYRKCKNFVEPIRDRKKIAQIKNQLRGQHRFRDLLMFVVGINSALRISDLLALRVEHFLNEEQQIRQRFWIKEHKRGKRQEIVINNSIRETLDDFWEHIRKSSAFKTISSSSTLNLHISVSQSSGAKPGRSLLEFVIK